MPALHLPAPLATLHSLPQKPQCDVELLMSVSQPLDMSLSQSRWPAGQFDTWHVPFSQVHCPGVAVQSLVHEPHDVGSEKMFRSQPVEMSPSQSWNPTSHAPRTHVPLEQLAVPFGTSQELPHVPQFSPSLSRFTSQPSDGLPLQSCQPTSHEAMAQAPVGSQTVLAWLSLHGSQPGAAQPKAAFVSSTQAEPQGLEPGGT